MKKYFTIDPWNIIEDGFHSEYHLISESIFSIGNGKMGMRGNFEEDYSGDSLQGNYLAGVYYPDKTKVGWWKNGYPEYFAKVLNTVNWIGLTIRINNQLLDLNKCKIISFQSKLKMKEGILERNFQIALPNGNEIEVHSTRFYSLVEEDLGTLKYSIKALNFDGKISIESHLDFDVRNEDANYNEKFWKGISTDITSQYGIIKSQTKKTNYKVACIMSNHFQLDDKDIYLDSKLIKASQRLSNTYELKLKEGQTISVFKYAITTSSFFYKKYDNQAVEKWHIAVNKGFDNLLSEHIAAWAKKWELSDIIIEGDEAAQQAIRFNIFMLNQTYTGTDSRLNIGPKGFTGEKYGGSTYWDTEAYCLPYYQSTAPSQVSKNLLIYRYNHLSKAIENAEKLGFKNGAALYPMVTMDGEECHNEWEITFEEIHRNGAIAYAIYNYVKYSGDQYHLVEYGIDVLIGIARFWGQRFNYSEDKKQYVMLGVTGPNEYENNVQNNWYTSYIARWTIKYTMEVLSLIKTNYSNEYNTILDNNNFNEDELLLWDKIIKNTYLPYDKNRGVFLQQDGFLDKELLPASSIPASEYPISQNWSWDRILRSCYIKQADVLQGLFFFDDDFSKEDIIQNFDFYEPMTVHESSLSPCVHSILACRIGRAEKAYELFLRTARLDLDNMNNDTEDGCHITSMAGTWMSIVQGFGGLKIINNTLSLSPILPKAWKTYSFHILFRNKKLKVTVKGIKNVEIKNLSKESFSILLNGKKIKL